MHKQWRNDRPCYPCYAGGGTLGGRHITEFTVFKRKIVRLGSKMDHILANLAFGRQKISRGHQMITLHHCAQNKIMRVLFGDRGKFLDKFRTCIRARPYPEQNLPSEFYVKEHSKPLFNKK